MCVCVCVNVCVCVCVGGAWQVSGGGVFCVWMCVVGGGGVVCACVCVHTCVLGAHKENDP